MRVGAACLVLLVTISAYGADAPNRFTIAYDRALPSIVLIEAIDKDGEPSAIGSGFVATSAGKIVTNLHVLKGASTVRITYQDGKTATVKALAASDENADLAVLQAPAGPQSLPISQASPKVGEEVISIGSPHALTNTLANGLVSAIRDVDGIQFVQTTTPISPGSSGGALLNLRGEVVGVVTFFFQNSQNLNFAVASKHIREVLKAGGASPFPPEGAETEESAAKPDASDLERDQARMSEILEKYNSRQTHTEKAYYLSSVLFGPKSNISQRSRPGFEMLLGMSYDMLGKNASALLM